MGKKGLFITVTFAFHVNIKESREKTPNIFVLRSWLLVIRWLLFDFHSRYIYTKYSRLDRLTIRFRMILNGSPTVKLSLPLKLKNQVKYV